MKGLWLCDDVNLIGLIEVFFFLSMVFAWLYVDKWRNEKMYRMIDIFKFAMGDLN